VAAAWSLVISNSVAHYFSKGRLVSPVLTTMWMMNTDEDCKKVSEN